MSITVSPESFRFVAFDADQIRTVAERMLVQLGLDGRDLHVEVDETTPLAKITAAGNDDGSITVRAESGAFEDTRRPRQMSTDAIRLSLGRALLRLRDRGEPGFVTAPPDNELTLPQAAAWETYCVGRLGRMGIPVNEQRWRYNFRNRHGFNDGVDAAFDRLWRADHLVWSDIERP